jgi:hypothetical protein
MDMDIDINEQTFENEFVNKKRMRKTTKKQFFYGDDM